VEFRPLPTGGYGQSADFARAGNPAQGIMIDLVARYVATPYLLNNTIAFEGQQKETNAGIHLVTSEMLPLGNPREQGPTQIAPKLP